MFPGTESTRLMSIDLIDCLSYVRKGWQFVPCYRLFYPVLFQYQFVVHNMPRVDIRRKAYCGVKAVSPLSIIVSRSKPQPTHPLHPKHLNSLNILHCLLLPRAFWSLALSHLPAAWLHIFVVAARAITTKASWTDRPRCRMTTSTATNVASMVTL